MRARGGGSLLRPRIGVMPAGTTPPPGIFARAVSAEVRANLDRRNMTIKALAAGAGITQGYLGKRLRDEAPLSLNDVENICMVLGEELCPFMRTAMANAGIPT